MSSFEAIFVPVAGEAYHAVVSQVTAAAKQRPALRALSLAEFSPPLPWLKIRAPRDDVPALGGELSAALGGVVLGLTVQTVVDAFGYWRFDAGLPTRVLVRDLEELDDRGSPEPWESGVIGDEVDAADAASAVFRHHDLPRFSDHRLRIGPAWPFRRFEVCW